MEKGRANGGKIYDLFTLNGMGSKGEERECCRFDNDLRLTRDQREGGIISCV